MIALFLTFLIAAYLLGPDLVSRWVIGFVCPRKNIVQSKGEELTRAIAWAVIPLGLAVLWARWWGTLSKCAGRHEWKLFFAGGYSNPFFEQHSDAIFRAVKGVFWWNFAVLWRMYFLVFLFWIGVDIIVYFFGRIRHRLSRSKLRWLNRLLTFFIIPRVSEWHVFLSNMLTARKDIRIHADILTKTNVLYRGYVRDKLLTAEGGLGSLLLADPQRFRRERYIDDVRTGSAKKPTAIPRKQDYWQTIPGQSFLIMGSEISTINLTHASPSAVYEDSEVIEALRKLIKEHEAEKRNGL